MCVGTLLFFCIFVAISSEPAETMGLTRYGFNAGMYLYILCYRIYNFVCIVIMQNFHDRGMV